MVVISLIIIYIDTITAQREQEINIQKSRQYINSHERQQRAKEKRKWLPPLSTSPKAWPLNRKMCVPEFLSSPGPMETFNTLPFLTLTAASLPILSLLDRMYNNKTVKCTKKKVLASQFFVTPKTSEYLKVSSNLLNWIILGPRMPGNFMMRPVGFTA